MRAEDPAGPEIGLTGARFGGASRRRSKRHSSPSPTATTDPAPVDAPVDVSDGVPVDAAEPTWRAGEAPALGLTGARFGGASRARRRPARTAPEVRNPEPDVVEPAPASAPLRAAADEDQEPALVSSMSVRPYVLTHGRTRSRFDLSLETLVSAVPMAAPTTVRGPAAAEHRAVIALCREPRSVAEVAAMIGLPLGVTRVMLGDLAVSGAVAVHRSVGESGPDLALMERVLIGLRRLR
jgi:Protein of unknown function (DUF742).